MDSAPAYLLDARPNGIARQLQRRQRNGQTEAARPCAPRIEVEHAADDLDLRAMRMTRDDDIDAGRHGVEVERLAVVQHVDRAAAQLHERRLRIRDRPLALVDVAPDRRHRRDLAQALDHLGAADVSGMDDVVDAREPFDGLGTQKTMRIRNDANPHPEADPAPADDGRPPTARRTVVLQNVGSSNDVEAGRPGRKRRAVCGGFSATTLPRRMTLRRAARSRMASIGSRACRITKSAWQPGAIP